MQELWRRHEDLLRGWRTPLHKSVTWSSCTPPGTKVPNGSYADHVGIVTAVHTDGTASLVNRAFLGSSNIAVRYIAQAHLCVGVASRRQPRRSGSGIIWGRVPHDRRPGCSKGGPRELRMLTQRSPVTSDRPWVIVDHLHRHITVSDGEPGGERAPTRRSVRFRLPGR